MHGGMKVYRGSAAAARTYVEAGRSRVDDYYLAEGTGLAERLVAVSAVGDTAGRGALGVRAAGAMDGDAYEMWVAGRDVESGLAKGRLRTDGQAVRFVEVVVNGPKTWSLAAAVHPELSAAYDAAQDRAAGEIIGWLAEHATTRVGPRGRQVQVPVEEIEAAVVRHHTSRAGDPHRHLHLQVNARVWAKGAWRGIHTVGVRDSLDAINGIGHAAVMCDPQFRTALATLGYTVDVESGEIEQLRDYAGAFSARAAQIARNVDRYEAEWRTQHPSEEPGRRLRQAWDTRAWADARPDKVVPRDGTELRQRWVQELGDLGFRPPNVPPTAPRGAQALVVTGPRVGQLNRDVFVEVALLRLGARRSGWNAADVRGEIERLVASVGLVAATPVRTELTEDLTHRVLAACVPLLARTDVPEHIRSLTSPRVLAVEHELTARLEARNGSGEPPARSEQVAAGGLDVAQQHVVSQLVGEAGLLVVEGAAGAGKTSTLAAVQAHLSASQARMVVVSPTLKAAAVAGRELGASAFSAAWLAHQHGFRWDDDGSWTRVAAVPGPRARLLAGDLLVVDEAGMLDQDTALALVTIADEAGARVALVGDRHQLPAVGRGGVLDLATDAAPEQACLTLETVHRFVDPDYADLTLKMRTGERPGDVFDALMARGDIEIHPTDVERLHRLAQLGDLNTNSNSTVVVADTRDLVAALNAATRDRRLTHGHLEDRGALTTGAGERLGLGDVVTTRRNDRTLGVANRETWTVTALGDDGSLTVAREASPETRTQAGTQAGTQGGTQAGTQVRRGERVLPAAYVRQHVELAYARTVYGAQGDTVDRAHFVLGEQTGAASAYVAMTRGRDANTAHLVAESLEDARDQWVGVFSRDRADLGPSRAAARAGEDLERYGGLDWQSAEALAATEATTHRRDPHRDAPILRPPEPARRGPGR